MFGYAFYDNELLVGTVSSLKPYLQGQKAVMYKNIDKLFQSLHPFAVQGISIRFLSDARALKAPWASYDLSITEKQPQAPVQVHQFSAIRDNEVG